MNPARVELKRLRRKLGEDIDVVSGLRAVHDQREEIDELLGDFDRQIDRFEQAPVLTLVGATGAGKSTLLNALAGQAIATEGIDRPTTRAPVIFAPRDADLSELLSGFPGPLAPLVTRYEPTPGLEAVYIDAPDLNSVAEEHAIVVQSLADRSDVLLVVLHRQSVVERLPLTFLDHFAGRRGLLFVLNRADELASESRAALLAQIGELVASRWHPQDSSIHAVSAKRARDGAGDDEWRHFRRSLDELCRRTAAGHVRRHNALGTAAQIGRVFLDIEKRIGTDLASLVEASRAGLDEYVSATSKQLEEHLLLHQPAINGVFCRSLAERWGGPASWALRAGSSSSVGLGLGVALARTHPLFAAATALSGFAAERLETIRETPSLVPPQPWIRSRANLPAVSSKIEVGRLFARPSALLTDDASEQLTASAIESGVTELIARDIPLAAESATLRFLRFPLDLPVWALAAWTIYLVSDGFARREYVGTDMLLSAALLAVVYLMLVRSLLRAIVNRSARTRILATAAKIRTELAAALSGKAERHAAEIRIVQAALHRLTTVAHTGN